MLCEQTKEPLKCEYLRFSFDRHMSMSHFRSMYQVTYYYRSTRSLPGTLIAFAHEEPTNNGPSYATDRRTWTKVEVGRNWTKALKNGAET